MNEALRPPESAQNQYDRRTLIKVGAWAAPVIVLATAAPAAAQSITPREVALTLTSAAYYRWGASAATGIGGTFTVSPTQNAGTGSTVTSMTLVVSLGSAGLATTPPAVTGAGWAFVSASAGSGVNAGRTLYTFQYTGTLSPGASSTLGVSWAAGAGFTTPSDRPWSAALSGSASDGTSVGSNTALGTVATVAANASSVSVPNAPVATTSGGAGKNVQLSVQASSTATVVARLTVTRQHANDAFIATAAWKVGSAGTAGSIDNTALTATTVPFTGPKTTAFPTFSKQTGGVDQNYRIQFIVDGALYPPATQSGVI